MERGGQQRFGLQVWDYLPGARDHLLRGEERVVLRGEEQRRAPVPDSSPRLAALGSSLSSLTCL
jgi:hypothetical protein